ncbi:hypothetical protein [Synechococcus sp. MU1655]|uniref:hypothetical protein n=1 Tax=unclassified Synechococcus TaxID=2626047 RepID=UPI0020275E7A|nr:hypothetical protein [Synechococcus sp. MU1655]
MDFQALNFSVLKRFLNYNTYIIQMEQCRISIHIALTAEGLMARKGKAVIQATLLAGCFGNELLANFAELVGAARLDHKVGMNRNAIVNHFRAVI